MWDVLPKGWKIAHKRPYLKLKQINPIIAKTTLFEVNLDINKYITNYEKIVKESNTILYDGKPINIFEAEYLITKNKYLINFFNQCKNNENIKKKNFYYDWIKTAHKLDDELSTHKKLKIFLDKKMNKEPNRQYYRGIRNKKGVINLTKSYQKLFQNIQKNGFHTPLYIKRSNLQLPGISDCSNRFAILIVLEYKSIQLLVNKGTLDLIKKYHLEFNNNLL